jgi:hypothetical protein
VEDFLHKFSEERSKLLASNFSKYIVARCWEKMHRRITHWFSRSTIRNFFFVNEVYLKEKFKSCEFTSYVRHDSALAGLLKGVVHGENVLEILKRLCPDHKMLPDIGKLVTAFELIRVPPETSAKRTSGTGWYTEATCYEFHKLYVCSLTAYANSLRILSKAHADLESLQNANITPKARITIEKLSNKLPHLFEQVWTCIHMLWRITDSRILRHHLRLLLACHYLPSPTKIGVPSENKAFGRITQELGLELGPESRGQHEVNPLVNAGQAEDDERSDSEEFNSMLEFPNLDKSFMRWTQLQVAFRVGQDILTSKPVLSSSILPKLEISIVTARYPSNLDREMEPWDALLRSQHLNFPQDFDREAAILAIQAQITSRIGQSCLPIFQRFQVPDFLPSFPGHLHCDMVLPLLARLAQDPVSSNALGHLAKVQLPLYNVIHHLHGLSSISMILSFRYHSSVVPCAGTRCVI